MKNGQNVYEITITLNDRHKGLAELISIILKQANVSDQDIARTSIGPDITLSFYKSHQKQAKRVQRVLAGAGIKNIAVSLKRLKPADWQTQWKQRFAPFALTPQRMIIPRKYHGSIHSFTGKKISIDTDDVFGTGQHPTTKYMAEFIEAKQGLFTSFFDIGVGTGILSIVAAQCGATVIDAIDIERKAIAVARRNFITNKVKPRSLRAISFEKYQLPQQYDFVAANLYTNDLIVVQEKLLQYVKPAKYLAVSGISIANYASFRKKFEIPSLRCLRVRKERGWTAILFKRVRESPIK